MNVGTKRAAVIFSLTTGLERGGGLGPDDQRTGIVVGLGRGHRRGGDFPVFNATSPGRYRVTDPVESGGSGLRGRPIAPPPGYPREAFGPSLDVTFPNDPYLVPFLTDGATRGRL